jgi:hypothetical protein
MAREEKQRKIDAHVRGVLQNFCCVIFSWGRNVFLRVRFVALQISWPLNEIIGNLEQYSHAKEYYKLFIM